MWLFKGVITLTETETDKMGFEIHGHQSLYLSRSEWTPPHNYVQPFFIGLGLCQCEHIVRKAALIV